MTARLAGKLALVTGGSSGIGAACARALADDGAAVVACGRRFAERSLAHVPSGGELVHAHLDVTDEREVDARFAELPRLDALVLSHGDATYAPVAETSLADLRAMLDAHVVGTLACARAALRAMAPRGGGHVVIVNSHAAQRAFTACGAYTAAKAGQLGLARVLAAEARAHGIRVTSILLGATDTPIWDARPEFDRAKMLKPVDVAGFVVDVIARPELAAEEVLLMPPAGAL